MMKAKRWWVLGVVVCSLVGSRSMAQDDSESSTSVETAPDAPAEDTAGVDADEFGDEPVASEESTPTARDTLDAPRSMLAAHLPPPPAARSGVEVVETAPLRSAPAEPLGRDAEVFVGVMPVIGFSGVAGLGGLAGLAGADGGLTGGADFVFAADRRTWLGFGLSLSHNESFEGASAQSRVSIPLIAQLYLDDPRRGEATPTLRIVPSFRWDQYYASSVIGYSRVGGALDVGVGITWFLLDFLAIRIMGDVGAAVMVSYDGAESIGIAANVGANVGVVVRL
jgi:hypothetical protein